MKDTLLTAGVVLFAAGLGAWLPFARMDARRPAVESATPVSQTPVAPPVDTTRESDPQPATPAAAAPAWYRWSDETCRLAESNGSKLLVFFTQPGCAPCVTAKEKLPTAGYTLVEVDITTHDGAAWGVTSTPKAVIIDPATRQVCGELAL